MIPLPDLTFTGPPADDPELLARLPDQLRELLGTGNGVIAFDGALHVRGACHEPAWHSLRHAWLGEQAFHHHYRTVTPDDIPFAEDCLGDQFLLRDGEVIRLLAETDDLEVLGHDLDGFLTAARDDPDEVLGLHLLSEYRAHGGSLAPGQLLNAYPPLCSEQADEGVTLQAIPTTERHAFLAELASALRDIPDGVEVRFDVTE